MRIALGLLSVAAVGILIALQLARRAGPALDRLPWLLPELARQHVIIMGVLGGFSMTGLVVIVAFTRTPVEGTSAPLGVAVLMLVVAIQFFVSNAFLLSYLPTAEAAGEVVPRLHFSLCSTIEYRTIFLSVFALIPLLRAHGLETPARILTLTIPVLLLFNTIVVAMIADGVGLVRFGETYVVAMIGVVLSGSFALFDRLWTHEHPVEMSTIAVSLAFFCFNGLSFAIVGLTPLAARYPGVRNFYDRHARRLAICDMQLTMMAQCLLWLAVSSII